MLDAIQRLTDIFELEAVADSSERVRLWIEKWQEELIGSTIQTELVDYSSMNTSNCRKQRGFASKNHQECLGTRKCKPQEKRI
ncbi:hypothetical protein SDC9_72879 [bioreactor metagenome]|uniref:Uncharacterized protein n=1 Tax=bioreactor metagenome TaxID=1076179 RepID=A0A644YEI2_9ZZZZ